MAANGKVFFVLFLAGLWSYGSSKPCIKLNNQFQELCSKINGGYNYTEFGFDLDYNGSSYQRAVYPKVLDLQTLLKTCSNVSELMVCTSFVPKCVQYESRPLLPCRQVCEQFVEQCGTRLEERNLRVFYAAMCHGLPTGYCIKPEGFEKQENHTKIAISLNCSTQTIPACIHGDYTHLPEDVKTKLIKGLNGIKPSSGCSEQLKRYLCYGQTTPCQMDSKSPYRPCRSFCEKLKRECAHEMRYFNLSFPLCDELPKERDRVGDLCRMYSWPVPKPSWKRCKCDTCGQIKFTCDTPGSCFIQKLSNRITGHTYTQQNCLDPGKARNFICGNTKNYLYAKCCEKDYCNVKEILVNPTTIPVTASTNASSTGTTPAANTVATTQNSSSTSLIYNGMYIITFKTTLASVIAITLKY